jgi:hypothetical protein
MGQSADAIVAANIPSFGRGDALDLSPRRPHWLNFI